MPRAMQCPFFQYYKALDLRCEAGKLSFPSRQAWTEYMDRYCGHPTGWHGCSLAVSMEREYEREDLENAQKKH